MRKEIYFLRKSVFDFFQNTILKTEKNKILEIGPMDIKFTPLKEFYIDTKKEFESKGKTYKNCDIFPESNCDYICDIMDLEKNINEKFDVIIACEVIEHVGKIWKLQDIFYNLLNENGEVYLSSPYHFFLHNPFPDYWRISKWGWELLFSEKFDVEISETFFEQDDRKPLHYKIKLTKKK
jgi:hypothetical protein